MLWVCCLAAVTSVSHGEVSEGNEDLDLRARVEANPGKLIEVPIGTHRIDRALVFNKEGSGLYGPGTIVQLNPAEEIIRIEGTSGIRIEDVTLTRAEGSYETSCSAVLAVRSSHLTFRNIAIRNNRFPGKTLNVQGCSHVRIDGCEVTNYKAIAKSDRTGDPDHGYAFHSIEGDGIGVQQSSHVEVRDNVVAEYELLSHKESADKHRLGYLTEGKHPTKLGKFGHRVVQNNRCQIWHQGSAFEMTESGKNKHFLLSGNKAINAAQGFDLHLDYGICSNNMVDHAVIGIKITHGSRNLVVDGNMVTHADLWGILVNPGLLSEAAADATTTQPAQEENVDRGIIISNNMITDFGYGNDYWNWGAADSHLAPQAIALIEGQEMSDPPLRDVLISGNMVYNSGRDGIVRGDKVESDQPRYEYAVYMGTWSRAGAIVGQLPQDIRFHGNVLEAGSRGVTNVSVDLKD